MSKRGIILVSTLFGLFALCFGVLGVRALTLGPDPARPSATELAARTTAANTLAQQVSTAKANTPPALPAVPDRVQAIAVSSSGGGTTQSGTAASGPAPVSAQRAPAANGGGEWEDEEEYEDEGAEYEDEGEHEEGDDDDD